MHFKGKDGQAVELKILGYQYESDFDNEWDANWLRIYLKVESEFGFWQTVDSSLTTWEIRKILEWFNELSQNIIVEDYELTFIEPNLAFELLDINDEFKLIQIKFEAESKPKSAIAEEEYFVNFYFSNKDLSKIVSDLTLEFNS
ncbi:MAG: WapI family immunity protein, partial [Flavitalea sp.]